MRVTVTDFKDKSVKSYIANLAHRSDYSITIPLVLFQLISFLLHMRIFTKILLLYVWNFVSVFEQREQF